jgi:excisionase family DNA binding protein
MTPKLLKAKEAAELLNVSVGKIRSDILHRRIEYVKLNGGSVRIPATAIERLVTAGTVPARGVRQ